VLLGNRWDLRSVGELDEVENLMEAGKAHVVFPRQDRIETLEGREGATQRRKKQRRSGGSSGGERRKPQRLCWMASERGKVRRASAL
jgi:hypothetical protein